MRTSPEKRGFERFEPPFLDVDIQFREDYTIRGRVLDSSLGGMAAALPENVGLPEIGSKVKLALINKPPNNNKIPIGDAIVKRSWSDEGLFDNGQGIALCFDSKLPEDRITNRLLQGIKQDTRLNSQSRLAVVDIGYLGDYRRDLIGCQLKLFVLALTMGVTLTGAYFGLTYHSVATSSLSDPNLSFWRTMIAALPGCLAIACGLMVAQKSISIQRIDSYLLVLKECLIRNQYPREYKGWETEYRKLRHILNTHVCRTCETKRRCGDLKSIDQQKLNDRKMFRGPKIDLYHIVIYMSFFSAFGLSTIAVLTELLKFQLGIPVYMFITAGITVVYAIATVCLFIVFYHLRKGKFSIEYYKRCWIDMLNRCRQPV